MRICEFCSKETNKKRFCSHQCYWEWSRGRKQSKKTIEKRRLKLFGHPVNLETRIKIGLAHKAEKSNWWKGDSVGYRALHQWLQREFGKADRCENPQCEHKIKKFEWALLKGKKYERKRENFWRLCQSCHAKYDFNPKNGFQKGWNKKI